MLRDVSAIRTQVTLGSGLQLSYPIGIAPTAFHKMAHSDGEQGTARGLLLIRLAQMPSLMREISNSL